MNSTQESTAPGQLPEQVLTTTTEPPPPAPEPAPDAVVPIGGADAKPPASPAPKAVTAAPAPAEAAKIPRKALLPLQLRASDFGAVEVNTDQGWSEVQVHRCFPWMEPGRFISLRIAEGEELALVKDLADLEPASRAALQAALHPASFAFEVKKIEAIKKDLELRIWVVETEQGLRTFETELDDWPREVAGGALLIQDVGGDLYRIADHRTLDVKSQKLLWAFLN